MSIEKKEVYSVEADTAEELRQALLEEITERIAEVRVAVQKAKRPVNAWLSLQRGMINTLVDFQKFLDELTIVPKTPKPNLRIVDKE